MTQQIITVVTPINERINNQFKFNKNNNYRLNN